MSDWPKDWPEDAKVGPGFLAQLMRRYPDKVEVGGIKDAEEWLDLAPLKHEGAKNVCDCCYLPIAEGHAPWCSYAEEKA